MRVLHVLRIISAIATAFWIWPASCLAIAFSTTDVRQPEPTPLTWWCVIFIALVAVWGSTSLLLRKLTRVS